MRIFGLDKLSLVDYSNYACAVIFTGGCNFKCPFCHNRGLVEREYSPIHQEDVLEFLNKRFGLIDAVCVSGGEPTLERGLLDFLQEIKNIEMSFLFLLIFCSFLSSYFNTSTTPSILLSKYFLQNFATQSMSFEAKICTLSLFFNIPLNSYD